MPAETRTVYLKDIAKELGVSYSLVAKVMGGNMGNTRARPELIQAIQDKAREMDYHPHPLASALKKGRKGSVGVLIHPVGEEGTEIAANLLRGVSEGLDKHQTRLWLRFYQTDDEFNQHFDKRARHEIDGLIVVGITHQKTMEQIDALLKSGMPAITIFEGGSRGAMPNISVDTIKQGYIATTHLLDEGCRKIAHISVRQGNNRRQLGYLKAHEQLGIAYDPQLNFLARDYKIESGRAAVRHWVENKLSFDGIVAQSDHQAIGAIHELMRLGIPVPEQVRVIGIDNSPLCLASPIPLSSVTSEWTQVGLHAAELIMSQIETKVPPANMWLDPNLVVRASSHQD